MVGPTLIRSNQDYKLAIASFNHDKRIILAVRMEGSDENGTNILNITKSVEVKPYTNRVDSFPVCICILIALIKAK